VSLNAEVADRFEEIGAAVTRGSYPGGHGIGQQELTDVVAFVESQVQ